MISRRSLFGILASLPFVGKAFAEEPISLSPDAIEDAVVTVYAWERPQSFYYMGPSGLYRSDEQGNWSKI